MALNSGIQTYQILTNNEEVCISSLSNILLAVPTSRTWPNFYGLSSLEFGIDVEQGINVGPGQFVKTNKRRA